VQRKGALSISIQVPQSIHQPLKLSPTPRQQAKFSSTKNALCKKVPISSRMNKNARQTDHKSSEILTNHGKSGSDL